MKNACKRLLSLALVLMLVISLIPAAALSVSAAVTYEQASSIAVGDKVVLATTAKYELSGISTTSTKYGLGTKYTTAPAGAWVLTVEAGSTSGTYAFKTPTNVYLSWTSGNSLTTSSAKNANSSWKVAFSGTNVTITNASNSSRYMQWNASSPRFACYENTGQTAVILFKQVEDTAPEVPCEVNLYENGELVDTLDAIVGDTVNLPTAESLAGYTFAGWVAGELEPTETMPTIYTTTFTPEEDCDLHAVYTYEVEGGSGTDFELYTGQIVEGDYLILGQSTTNAMSATVSSSRLANVTVTVSNNKVSNPDAAAIWHIAPVDGGYTFYNASKNVYAASNGTKNQAAAITAANDKAVWTISGTTSRTVENASNKTAGVNYTLRNNGTYGFACYAASTGAAPAFYKSASTTTVYTTVIDTDCKHTNVETVAEEPATCTDTGATAYTRCADCLAHITEPETIPALGHNFVAGEVTPPTVLDDGYTTYECSRCDATEKRDIVKAEGVTVSFSVPEGVAAVADMQAARAGITLPAAVAPEGYTFIGWATESIAKTEDKPTVAAAGANYKTEEAITLYAVFSQSTGNGWTLVTDDSVLEAGKQVIITSKDGKKALGTTQNTNNRSGVDFDVNNIGSNVQILILEDGTKDGTFAFKADAKYLYAASSSGNQLKSGSKNDNASWLITISGGTASIVAQGTNTRATMQYNPNNGSPIFACYASASQTGLNLYILDGTTYYMSDLNCDHDYEEEITVEPTCEDEGELTYTCIYCGDSYTETIEPNGHDYDDGTITLEPTCNDEGVLTYACYECEATYTEVVAALGHTEKAVAGYAPDCVNPGLTDGVQCEVCSEWIVAQQVIPALGHTEITVPGYAADCVNPGLTDGVKCDVCGEWITEQEIIPALGHTEITVPGYAADCENDGLTDGVKCDVCGEWITEQETIPALNHSFTEYTYNDDATVYEDGTETATCDNGCGKTDTRPAAGTKIPAVAAIGDALYATLAEAVAAAEENATVTLLATTSGAGVVIDKNITINFGGFTYTFTEGVGSTGTATNGLQILQGNTVVLENGKLDVAAEAADKFYILVQNYADLTVKDMILDGTNLDKYAFTDGDSYTLSNNSGIVNILGATDIIANNDGDLAFAFDVCDSKYYANKPVVNVNTTGTITGAIEVSATINENLNISGGSFTVALEKAWCAEGFLPVRSGDTYTVLEIGNNVAYNEAAGELYEDLQTALQAAEGTGATVKLITNVEAYSIIVPAGVTLDLNGCTAELDYVTATGKIVDSLGGGLLRTAEGKAILLDQDALPVWNGTDGYLFLSDIKLNNETYTVYQFNETDAGLELVFMPWLAKELRSVFADGAADNGISLKLRLTWNGVNGPMSMDVNYKDAFVKDVYDDCAQAFNLTIANASQLEGLTFQIVLVSDTGAEFTSQIIAK